MIDLSILTEMRKGRAKNSEAIPLGFCFWQSRDGVLLLGGGGPPRLYLVFLF